MAVGGHAGSGQVIAGRGRISDVGEVDSTTDTVGTGQSVLVTESAVIAVTTDTGCATGNQSASPGIMKRMCTGS